MSKPPEFTEKAYCSVCGSDIQDNIKIIFTNKGTKTSYYIKPCQKCLENEYEEGELAGGDNNDGSSYENGYASGYEKGVSKRY